MADQKNIRIPPHSTEAEESVLGALLLDKDAILAVAEILAAADFYDTRHKEIYGCILELYEDRIPVDVLTVSDALKKKQVLKKIGGVSYLAELASKVPTAAHVEHYGRIVKNASTKRSLMEAAAKLVDLSFDEALPAENLLDRAEFEVFSLTQSHLTKSFTPVREALAESFDRLDELHKQGEGLRGVPTGFKDLDDALAGMQKSNLIILAARPGVGKTSLALNIAQSLAVSYNRPIGFFSLEMSREELVDRLLVAQADIDAWRLKTGKLTESDFTALSNAMGVLAEAPIYIDDTPGLSITEMRTKARRLQVDVGIDLLIVDYLQLARSRNLENRVQEVSEISQGLKNLARELKIPVLALSQLSRAIETRGEKKPQLSDLRESGCLLGDTLITLANGERVEIKAFLGKRNVKVLALDGNLKLKTTQIKKVFSSGKKVVYKLVLKSGKAIEASGNHPFLKLYGWERLDKLMVGDKIATPRILPCEPVGNTIDDNKIIVLAHLLGNGCFVKRQPLYYTNSDKKLIDIVKKAAEKEFGIVPRMVVQKNWYHLYLSSKQRLARGRRNPIVKWLDEDLGIYGQHSRQKEIPKAIFELPDSKVSLFLKHLWTTDGCVHLGKSGNKRKVSLYYSSGSRSLAEGVSYLLLRLGVLSTTIPSRKKGYGDVWNVNIWGKVSQLMFMRKVGFIGEKVEMGKRAKKFLQSIKENPNNDVIPKSIWKEIERLRIAAGITTREFHRKLGWAYSGTQRQKNGLSRKRLERVLKVVSSPLLKKLSSSDIYWDEVKSIKKVGVREVYDATVPGYANFVANQIFVHNSIEQDADVVMFLWREDEEKMENMVLDIAKHRNGPLKSIKLFFKSNRIRFFGRDTKQKE